jgi:hypothetical protein
MAELSLDAAKKDRAKFESRELRNGGRAEQLLRMLGRFKVHRRRSSALLNRFDAGGAFGLATILSIGRS